MSDSPTYRRTPENAVLTLLDLGIALCHQLKYPCEFEASDRSEARYLYVYRAPYWFGYRIASHTPVYRCSADYQQVLLPEFAFGETLRRAGQYLQEAIRTDGYVVAAPSDVWEAIRAAETRLADGYTHRGDNGDLWIWCGHRQSWSCDSDTALSETKPRSPPRVRLNAQGQCQVRHQLNFRARWIHDLEQSASTEFFHQTGPEGSS